MVIEIYQTEKSLKNAVDSIENLQIPERNKELIREFVDNALVGWNGEKLSKKRVLKYISVLKYIVLILGEKKFDYVTTVDIKKILRIVDDDPKKGEWAQYDYRILIKRYITWLREEHGYPEDYPDREEHMKALSMIKLGVLRHALEVLKIKAKQPDKLRDRDTIPSKEYITYMREAAINPRDRAFLAILEEVGARIGGLGTRQIKHVEFDDIGAQIYMSDKTLRGEPVRLTWSAAFLREWIGVHPYRTDMEAPLWVNMQKTKPVPLNYKGLRSIVKRVILRHNRRAKENGLPEIPHDYGMHAFRYYAQIRDELNGVPRAVQVRQRGWTYNSNMPSRYARLVSKEVDEFYRKKLGISDTGEEEQPYPCPRCREINLPKSRFCKRCGMPLTKESMKYKDEITTLALRMLKDPELSKEILEAFHFSDGVGKDRNKKEVK
ncbi:hypothetical protein BMS3Bbin15_01434 [archaeon BMS3Bbin15]|nr:hypothetical protein BMS3Bbin15_01434 [archaeon BMS3Bbin15]